MPKEVSFRKKALVAKKVLVLKIGLSLKRAWVSEEASILKNGLVLGKAWFQKTTL